MSNKSPYYSKISPGYNDLYKNEQLEKLRLISPFVKPGLILDIAAGTGFSSLISDNIIHLEPSFEMLRKSPGIKVCGMAEHLPFKSSIFDSVICLTAIHHFDLGKAIAEIKRVAKPDAFIAISVLKKARNFPAIVSRLRNEFNLEQIDHEKDIILVKKAE